MHELSRREAIALAGLGVLAAGCGNGADHRKGDDATRRTASGTTRPARDAVPPARPAPKAEDLRVGAPEDLTRPLLSSDVLVYSQNTLDRQTVEQIRGIEGVASVEPISMAQFFVDEQEVTYAAVDPATFWRYTVPGTAHTEAVWKRVAGGEIAVQPQVARRVQTKDAYLKLGNGTDAHTVHIGAVAQLLDPGYARQIDAVVNYKWARSLGMRPGNAMIVSMPVASPQSVRKQLQQYAGTKASIQILGPDLDIHATQTAFLTGGSVAAAVGSFSYTAHSDGTVAPDPSWVAARIRSEEMPIIGRVTGNTVMLPQLKAALSEVQMRGLASKIYHYDGCYVPRFIAHDPSKGLSFHTFGTAIDLNAADNGRGTVGLMDRRVVAIFKRWGFAWGGDWHYTDPMHFELARLVEAR